MGYFDASIDAAFRRWEKHDAASDPANALPCPDCGPAADDGENSMYWQKESGQGQHFVCVLCGLEETHGED